MTRNYIIRQQTTILFVIFVACFSSQPVQSFVVSPAAFRNNHRRGSGSPTTIGTHNQQDDNNENDMQNDMDGFLDTFDVVLPAEEQMPSRKELEELTITQLKQQLRLRKLKVSGTKRELIDRILGVRAAQVLGKEIVDVTDFLDEQDQGKAVRTLLEDTEPEEPNAPLPEPEVWGTDARIVDDYEGRQVVVDGMSRTVVEFQGSNLTQVAAYVVASRDALQPFLAGSGNNQTKTPAEMRLREIQSKREQATKRPVKQEDTVGLDEGDETGIYASVLDREVSDWGKYTATGAQLSAAEVQGVLLLSDVYGAFHEDTRALADKIAFECQPVVVMVPDLFRGQAWEGPTDGCNPQGQSYEQWRQQHDELRVSVDIRAAAACLRERYGVNAVVVWGTCFGGGRALEAAAGYLPNGNIHDVEGNVGPPPVDPMVAIAWYPTRYDVSNLFGKMFSQSSMTTSSRVPKSVSIMAVFGGNDQIPGATARDAEVLNSLLKEDTRVKDFMVKVFPEQDHGFAHRGMAGSSDTDDDLERFVDDEFGGAGRVGLGDGDAEVACLLSTAFMETYSRVFLPTVGPPIQSADEIKWSSSVIMDGLSEARARDVRAEIQDAVENFVEEPLGGYRIDPSDPDQEEQLLALLKSMEEPAQKRGPYAIEDDDDISTVYAKLKAADPDFQIF